MDSSGQRSSLLQITHVSCKNPYINCLTFKPEDSKYEQKVAAYSPEVTPHFLFDNCVWLLFLYLHINWVGLFKIKGFDFLLLQALVSKDTQKASSTNLAYKLLFSLVFCCSLKAELLNARAQVNLFPCMAWCFLSYIFFYWNRSFQHVRQLSYILLGKWLCWSVNMSHFILVASDVKFTL